MQEQPVDLTLLSAYLDGEVTAEERALVEAQLRLSPAWREELDGLRWTVSLLRELPEAPLPRSFELPVPAETARATTRGVTRQAVWGLDLGWLYGFLRASAVVTVALLMAVAGLDVFQTQRDLARDMTALNSPASAPAPEVALSQRAAQPQAEAPRAAAPQAAAPAVPTTAPAAKPGATTAPAAKALQNPAVQPTFPAAAAPPRPGSGGGGGGGGGETGGLGGGAGQGAGGTTSEAQDGVTIVATPAPAAGAVQSSATPDTPPLAFKAQPQAQPQAAPQPSEAQSSAVAPTEPTARWRWLETALAALALALAVGAWAVRRRLKARE